MTIHRWPTARASNPDKARPPEQRVPLFPETGTMWHVGRDKAACPHGYHECARCNPPASAVPTAPPREAELCTRCKHGMSGCMSGCRKPEPTAPSSAPAPRFRVGDRVRIRAVGIMHPHWDGKLATLLRRRDQPHGLMYDVNVDGEGEIGASDEHLEPAPEQPASAPPEGVLAAEREVRT